MMSETRPTYTLFPCTTLFRSVLGWVMNQARSRALDCLRFENRKKRTQGDVQPLVEVAADPCDVVELREHSEALRDREEHTSELQSRRDFVCRLLLEKKKQLFV